MHTAQTLPPLVVDLDGTLIANDLLLETASRFVSQNPRRLPQLIGWLAQGKARLKRELWAAAPIDVAHLRYNVELVRWLKDEKDQGRILVLASAGDQLAVRAVAEHLGIFDIVLGSDGTSNLRGDAKALALVERFGEQGFEYVGNHRNDLAVWRHATAAHVVSKNAGLIAKARHVTPAGRTFEFPPNTLRIWLRALRTHQWAKNVLVLLPLLTAHRVTDVGSDLEAVSAFISFSLAASSVYLLNDIVDVEHDRDHPTKRNRPFAAGTANMAVGWALWPILSVAALTLAFTVSLSFGLVLICYLAITVAYSFHLKRKPVIDVVTLAALYTIRVVAGAAAIEVSLSMWLLSFSSFFFLSLALVKRVSELYSSRNSGMAIGTGRGYRSEDLELLSSYGVATSVASVLVFTLFVNDPATARLYHYPNLLWASVPILLTWLMRMWLLAHRGEMNEDPILFAIQDRISIVCGLMVVVVFVAATVVSG